MLDLTHLNPQQREAVLTTEGPLLILAGAGSGKTRVLTHRVAHLVLDKGVDHESVLAITFTNKATNEMRRRISDLVGKDAYFIQIGTFHRVCLDMLRSYYDLVGLPAKFNLVNPDEAKKIITRLCSPTGVEPGPAAAAISKAKNELVSPGDMFRAATNPYQREVAGIYESYEATLRASKVLDLDGILMESHRLLVENPEVLAAYQDRYRYIHVDEYQDTCHAQYRIVALLAAQHRNLMVVGDDDQSIYAFRSADIRNILSFEKEYPGAKVVVLGTNYRSTGNILSVAGALIQKNRARRAKRLDTPNPAGAPVRHVRAVGEREEADFVAGAARVLIRNGTPPAEIAVLYRVATLSSDLESAFLRAGIKYEVVRGTRYVDRKAVRDALAYISTAVHPEDEISLRRIANVPRRGLGDVTLDALDRAAKDGGMTLREAVRGGAGGWIAMAPKGRAAAKDLDDTLTKVEAAMACPSLVEQVEAILKATGLLTIIPKSDNPDQDTAGDLMKLVDIADALVEEKPDADLTDLLDFLALQSEADDSAEDSGQKVKLLTIHASKGLEFQAVFVVGCEDGILPHRRAFTGVSPAEMEEERRLMYVAMTRAKNLLTLSSVAVRRLYGERKSAVGSRFLQEIPEHMIKRSRV